MSYYRIDGRVTNYNEYTRGPGGASAVEPSGINEPDQDVSYYRIDGRVTNYTGHSQKRKI
jgi:hypothetical protein